MLSKNTLFVRNRTRISAAAFLLFSAGLAAAQTNIVGDGKCSPADVKGTAPIADRANHSLQLVAFGNCTWTTPFDMGGLKSKDYTGASTSDDIGGKGRSSGYVVITMDNGDKAFVRFTGTYATNADHSGTGEGTWSYTGGTGKMRGLNGKGTFKSTSAADGTVTDHVEGEYSLPAAKPAPKK